MVLGTLSCSRGRWRRHWRGEGAMRWWRPRRQGRWSCCRLPLLCPLQSREVPCQSCSWRWSSSKRVFPHHRSCCSPSPGPRAPTDSPRSLSTWPWHDRDSLTASNINNTLTGILYDVHCYQVQNYRHQNKKLHFLFLLSNKETFLWILTFSKRLDTEYWVCWLNWTLSEIIWHRSVSYHDTTHYTLALYHSSSLLTDLEGKNKSIQKEFIDNNPYSI